MRIAKQHILIIVATLLMASCSSQQISLDNSSEKSHLAGGWSEFMQINSDEMGVFEQATAQLLGVTYHPTEVSKQIVSGMNYRFRCTATPATLNPKSHQAIIQIYAPVNGNPPTITSIERAE
ncbi:MAG: hypothetical protein R3Y22_07990 [Bacteroidales bacterium]